MTDNKKRMGLYPNNGEPWSDESVEFLKTFYIDPDISVKEIARSLGRTKAAVCIRAHHLGLTRSVGIPSSYSKTQKQTKNVMPTKNIDMESFMDEIDAEKDMPESVMVPEVKCSSMKDVDFDDACFIKLCRGEQGKIKAFVKFKGGWNIDKITHPYAMSLLKNVDVLGVVKDV